jgi:hypothetical protein
MYPDGNHKGSDCNICGVLVCRDRILKDIDPGKQHTKLYICCGGGLQWSHGFGTLCLVMKGDKHMDLKPCRITGPL